MNVPIQIIFRWTWCWISLGRIFKWNKANWALKNLYLPLSFKAETTTITTSTSSSPSVSIYSQTHTTVLYQQQQQRIGEQSCNATCNPVSGRVLSWSPPHSYITGSVWCAYMYQHPSCEVSTGHLCVQQVLNKIHPAPKASFFCSFFLNLHLFFE